MGTSGLQLWGPDPVHPLPEGYARIADLLLKEWDRSREKKRKRTPDGQEPASKRPKYEAPHPRWIDQSEPRATLQSGFSAGEDRVEAEAEASVPGGAQGGAVSRMCTTKSRWPEECRL